MPSRSSLAAVLTLAPVTPLAGALLLGALLLAVAAPALATPVSSAATPAFNDAFASGVDDDGHAIWLPGLGNDYIPGSLTFTEDLMAGMASLVGTVVDATQPGNGFDVNISFTGLEIAPPPAGSPVKDLIPAAYIENLGPVDPSTWRFFTVTDGTLLGTGGNTGAIVDLARAGPSFQVGVGANGKNILNGASGWVAFTVVQHPDAGDFQLETGVGDINIELPEPTTAVLLPLGLGALALRRRSRRLAR